MTDTAEKFLPKPLPSFDELPLRPSDPPFSAWGLWGASDQLGCLNHLTPERVKAAAAGIKSGFSVGLSWEMHQMHVPPSYRSKLEHEIFSIGDNINVSLRYYKTLQNIYPPFRMTKLLSTPRQAPSGTVFGTGHTQMEDSITG
jgi:hypothetical protein